MSDQRDIETLEILMPEMNEFEMKFFCCVLF